MGLWKLEKRLLWAEKFLSGTAFWATGEKRTALIEVMRVLQFSVENHGPRPPVSAHEHLDHALGHLKDMWDRSGLFNIDADSGLHHRAHAAARCLLAFGAILGLDKED